MTLTDLQVKLRSCEELLRKLYVEIEDMKPKSSNGEQESFSKITRQAKQYPIVIKSLKTVPLNQKILFINTLSHIMIVEEKDYYERLLYLCRISKGCELNFDAEEIYKNGLKFNEQDVGRIGEELTELRYVLLVEALVLANITGKASSYALNEIAEAATLLKCNKSELKLISQFAKIKLTNNWDLLREIEITKNKKIDIINAFYDYISCIPQGWFIKQRVACCNPILIKGFFKGNNGPRKIGAFRRKGDYRVKKYDATVVKEFKKNNDIVKEGDRILKYKHKVRIGAQTDTEDTIRALSNGKLFVYDFDTLSEVQDKIDEYKLNKVKVVYVVSYFDNFKDFCKWIKTAVKINYDDYEDEDYNWGN